ncbi:MCP domain-containing signal transducer [Haloferax larsenii JCM 13917]|nr:MCP domain-containing signal transducer [Haloferax larsenii JCM 13917]
MCIRDRAQSAQDIAIRVDDVANISEETAGQSQTVVETADRQSDSIDDLADQATLLSSRAANLEGLVGSFDVLDEQRAVSSPADD